jgi:hypothetical protein
VGSSEFFQCRSIQPKLHGHLKQISQLLGEGLEPQGLGVQSPVALPWRCAHQILQQLLLLWTREQLQIRLVFRDLLEGKT